VAVRLDTLNGERSLSTRLSGMRQNDRADVTNLRRSLADTAINPIFRNFCDDANNVVLRDIHCGA